MKNNNIDIELTKEEGLKLFELLIELKNNDALPVSDADEKKVLNKIMLQLEEKFFGVDGCESLEMIEELRMLLEKE